MAKSSFADADAEAVTTPEVVAPVANQQTSVVPATGGAVGVPDSFFHNEGMEGDIDRSDIKMPRLALGQNVGPLTNELGFKPGDFVFNKEVALGPNIKVTLVRISKYYLQDLPFGSEEMPLFFKTADDARRAGHLSIQDKYSMDKEARKDHKFFKPVLDADVLIEGYATAEYSSFPLDFNGTPYALARWSLQSTAYSRVGKQFITDGTMALKSGLSTKHYTVSAKREKLGANFVFVPTARLAGKNSDEFVQWAEDLTS